MGFLAKLQQPFSRWGSTNRESNNDDARADEPEGVGGLNFWNCREDYELGWLVDNIHR